jgi:chemosensory pili system protein ChpC
MAEEKLQTENLGTLLFNIEGGQIMLPDIAVAEIIEFREVVSPEGEVPVWFLGHIEWRGLTIPVVSFEAMNHGSFFTHSNRLKIIVINGLAGSELRYWAFVTLETPKMQRINSDSIVADNTAELGEAQLMAAELMGEPVIIPDLVKIEKNILSHS